VDELEGVRSDLAGFIAEQCWVKETELSWRDIVLEGKKR
jgi:hypothetical protein